MRSNGPLPPLRGRPIRRCDKPRNNRLARDCFRHGFLLRRHRTGRVVQGDGAMLRGPLAEPGFRGHFSGHETFPLRHLWLRKAYDAVTGTIPARRNLFTDPEAIITFGVGKNMVTSIRHWALTCSIIEESGEIYRPTALGKFLFDLDSGRDPYMESPATIWLLQWLIAGSAERSTTWFYAFNHLTVSAFDREAVAQPIREFCAGKGWRTS